MNRRTFIQRAIAGAGILAAPSILVPEKKFWQLDKTMWTPESSIATPDWELAPTAYSWQELARTKDESDFLFTMHSYEGRKFVQPLYVCMTVPGDYAMNHPDMVEHQRLAFRACELKIQQSGDEIFV